MKKILIIFCLMLSLPSYSKNLKCSANGTDVYYVNGVLTNFSKNNSDKEAIRTIINKGSTVLDSGLLQNGLPPVSYIGIHNPSFGLVNDAAELFSQAYYINNGKDINSKAIYNAVQNLPEVIGSLASVYDPSHVSSVLGMFGFSPTINYVTLKGLANESNQIALERSIASVDTLVKENNLVVDSIASHLTKSKESNRKILFVAHSQGNAVLEAGLKRLVENKPSEMDYISKYVGIYHVASPVPPLELPYMSRSIRSEQDKIIAAVQFLPGYPTTAAPVTHRVTSRSKSDLSGHLFFDTYISPDVSIVPINNLNAAPVSMSDNFVLTLSDLATDLDDNCSIPDIDIEIAGAIKNSANPTMFDYQGYTNFYNKTSITAKDKNDNDNSTTFNFSYNTYCPDCGVLDRWSSKSQENVKSITDFSIPFSKRSYSIYVTATNKYGKSASRDFYLSIPNDQPSTIQLVSQVCWPNCAYGCGGLSVAYDATFIISDPDSEIVTITASVPLANEGGAALTGRYNGQAYFYAFNMGASYDPLMLTLNGLTSYTVPACVSP
ncbi:MAG: hypothetical protein ACXVLQ_10230 [Bacteriovorax sp.]